MRVNVYSQELITDADEHGFKRAEENIQTVEKTSNTGLVYSAVMMLLHSSERLHHPPADDDRSAIAFWLPKSPERREMLAQAFEEMATQVRAARPETGLD